MKWLKNKYQNRFKEFKHIFFNKIKMSKILPLFYLQICEHEISLSRIMGIFILIKFLLKAYTLFILF